MPSQNHFHEFLRWRVHKGTVHGPAFTDQKKQTKVNKSWARKFFFFSIMLLIIRENCSTFENFTLQSSKFSTGIPLSSLIWKRSHKSIISPTILFSIDCQCISNCWYIMNAPGQQVLLLQPTLNECIRCLGVSSFEIWWYVIQFERQEYVLLHITSTSSSS